MVHREYYLPRNGLAWVGRSWLRYISITSLVTPTGTFHILLETSPGIPIIDPTTVTLAHRQQHSYPQVNSLTSPTRDTGLKGSQI